ncbi:MAG: hypothetical protein JWQ98_1063 [Chlorobi bacterium]|nr:hypothetical protein [Chlorobiota bacterium]
MRYFIWLVISLVSWLAGKIRGKKPEPEMMEFMFMIGPAGSRRVLARAEKVNLLRREARDAERRWDTALAKKLRSQAQDLDNRMFDF